MDVFLSHETEVFNRSSLQQRPVFADHVNIKYIYCRFFIIHILLLTINVSVLVANNLCIIIIQLKSRKAKYLQKEANTTPPTQKPAGVEEELNRRNGMEFEPYSCLSPTSILSLRSQTRLCLLLLFSSLSLLCCRIEGSLMLFGGVTDRGRWKSMHRVAQILPLRGTSLIAPL